MSDFKLVRVATGPGGAFGVLLHGGLPFAVTLERVFDEKGEKSPIVPVGLYVCTRTVFYKYGYDTYEITEVPGHTRILFHRGSMEADSAGCVLVADTYQDTWIANSKVGFSKFMDRAAGRQKFNLEVV